MNSEHKIGGDTASKADSFLRITQVLARVPVSKSTLYAKVKSGEWCAPVKISARVTAFRKSDVDALCERLANGGAK
jgi:prophage regulatory protein